MDRAAPAELAENEKINNWFCVVRFSNTGNLTLEIWGAVDRRFVYSVLLRKFTLSMGRMILFSFRDESLIKYGTYAITLVVTSRNN